MARGRGHPALTSCGVASRPRSGGLVDGGRHRDKALLSDVFDAKDDIERFPADRQPICGELDLFEIDLRRPVERRVLAGRETEPAAVAEIEADAASLDATVPC